LKSSSTTALSCGQTRELYIYVVFVERGLGLLNPTGLLGFILPHKFFNAEYGTPLRTLLTEARHLAHVVHFGSQQVFAAATNLHVFVF